MVQASADYWRELGLTRDPFPLRPVSRFLDDELKRRLDLLVYLIQSGDQMVLVRGEPGSGKSTLLAQFLESAGDQFTVCPVDAGEGLNAVRLVVAMSQAFADDLDGGGDSEDLADRLVSIQASGGTPLLIVDGAEMLHEETLNTVLELYERMGESGRLLRVVLFGGVGVEELLGGMGRFQKYRAELRTLDITPFSERQVEAYIAWALRGAGLSGEAPFSGSQLRSIYEQSAGLPGRINEVARRMLGGEAAEGVARGGVMNLTKLGNLDIKKVLTWSGVAVLLLAILIFQGRINEMIQGDAPQPFVEEEEPPASAPIAIQRGAGAMPGGTLPDQIVRDPARRMEPPAEPPVVREEPPPTGVDARDGVMALTPPPAVGQGVARPPITEMPVAAAGVVGGEPPMDGIPPPAEEAPLMGGEVDPLAGAPIEHRVPQLERPTPFKPSESEGEGSAASAPAEPMTDSVATAKPTAEPLPVEAAALPADGAENRADGASTVNAEVMAAASAEASADGGVAPAAEAVPTPMAKPPETVVAKPEPNVEPTPEPVTTPEPKAEPESPSKMEGLKGEAWLLEQPRRHIALQVLGGPEREALVAFAEKHQLSERGAIFRGSNRGRIWYGLLAGVYPDLSAARDALKALPPLPKGYRPWTRSVVSVQMEIEKAKK